ncbi:hypothetical protein [Paenibacillus sp. TH7-28]
MKEAIKIDPEGYYVGVKHVDDAFSGVVPFYADPPEPAVEMPTETDTEAADEQLVKEPQSAGYIVGVPVPAGLYLPRFDLVEWQTYQDAVAAAQEAYRAACDEWAAQPEDERGEMPAYTVPEQPQKLWTEGLTTEEIAALHPPAELTELERLQAENLKLKQAIAELAEANEADKTN